MAAAREEGARPAIAGMRCGECGVESAPAQPVCPHCGGNRRLEAITLPPRGTLYSFTVVHVAPAGLEGDAPYALGIVELEGGARITARIEGAPVDGLAIGAPLALARAEAGICFFRPA